MLYVLVPSYPLTDYLFEDLDDEPGIRVIRQPFGKRGRLKSLSRILETYLLVGLQRSWYYGAEHVEKLQQIKPEDSVLYFAIENRKDLQITRKFVRARRQSIWLWNPIRSYRSNALSRWFYQGWLHRAGVDAYTFDSADALASKLGLAPQVYRRAGALAPSKPLIDLYFVGIDKGRLEELKSWKKTFVRLGLSSHFHIVADKRKTYDSQDQNWVTQAWIPYRKNLALVQQARCLLELLQGSQSGPTIRSMEALFFGRKLITNNASILEADFYRRGNIFVIGHDRPEDLQVFLQTPLESIDEQVLAKHEIRNWLRQFETMNCSDNGGL